VAPHREHEARTERGHAATNLDPLLGGRLSRRPGWVGCSVGWPRSDRWDNRRRWFEAGAQFVGGDLVQCGPEILMGRFVVGKDLLGDAGRADDGVEFECVESGVA